MEARKYIGKAGYTGKRTDGVTSLKTEYLMLWGKYIASNFPQMPHTSLMYKGEKKCRPKCVMTAAGIDPFLFVNLTNASSKSRSDTRWKF
jgi:hypothetical protein